MSALDVYDGTAYRQATAVSVWDGAAWRVASGVWVWDGSAWQQGFTAAVPKIATPTCSASWDLAAHVMDVSVTPTGTPPAGTVWQFTSSLGNTGSCTEPTRTITVSEPEDGALECWTVHGSATGWTSSDESPQSCANRGNPQ